MILEGVEALLPVTTSSPDDLATSPLPHIEIGRVERRRSSDSEVSVNLSRTPRDGANSLATFQIALPSLADRGTTVWSSPLRLIPRW